MQNIDVAYWTALVVNIGLKIGGAIIVWVIGRWLISLSMRLLTAALTRQHVEATLIRYLISFLTIALNIVLVVAILGYFGFETTSFAALIAAVGIAIGAAWAGLLSNFAAGAFLLMFRPFKVGDYILAGGVEGTVVEIGLFTTTINTPDNVWYEVIGVVAHERLTSMAEPGREQMYIGEAGQSQDGSPQQNGESSQDFNQNGKPRHEMRRRNADCMQDGSEGFRSPGQLGESVLHEAIPHNQPERNGSPARERRWNQERKAVAVSL